ncbi:MAG TPA: hypothetical protein PK509_06515 [Catalimonadaceae bacterium]|nr:hypothetical protein [Catalimonadaceae bacterium]
MEKIFYSVLLSVSVVFGAWAQQATVTVKGQGTNRTEALNDARRNAIASGIGTRLSAETQMQDMVAVRDAVTTQTQGIVTNETILKEGMVDGMYELELQATVNKDTYEANVRTLSQMVGGIRFLTIVNPDLAANGELPDIYRFAVDRVNEYLLQKKYRVLESKRYFQILKATKSIFDKDDSDLNYEQKLGMLADAQMLFEIDKINVDFRPGNGQIPGQTKVFFDVKVFDNCTGELLGTTPLESGYIMLPDANAAQREAVKNAVEKGMVRVLYLFNESMGSWINEGAPYRVRIYNTTAPPLTSRDMRQFKNKLTSNADFGGTFEPNLNNGYFLYNLAYKKRSDQMTDLLMDYSDETEALQPLKMDASFQFGRFICLTPTSKQDAVRPLQDLNKVKEAIEKQQSTNEDAPLNLDNVLKKTKAVKPAVLNKPNLAGSTKPVVPSKKTTVKKTTKKK